MEVRDEFLYMFEGSLVANYPYDDSDTGKDGIYTPSIDDKLFTQLAYTYARAHTNMYFRFVSNIVDCPRWKTGRRCGLSADGDSFLNGVTNGAGWYHLAGGMQDWQYVHTDCFEITVEMGCYKFPLNYMYAKLWPDHEFSLISFLSAVHSGLKVCEHRVSNFCSAGSGYGFEGKSCCERHNWS